MNFLPQGFTGDRISHIKNERVNIGAGRQHFGELYGIQSAVGEADNCHVQHRREHHRHGNEPGAQPVGAYLQACKPENHPATSPLSETIRPSSMRMRLEVICASSSLCVIIKIV